MRRSSIESMVSMQRGDAIANNESDDAMKEKHSECSHKKHTTCGDDDRYNKVQSATFRHLLSNFTKFF